MSPHKDLDRPPPSPPKDESFWRRRSSRSRLQSPPCTGQVRKGQVRSGQEMWCRLKCSSVRRKPPGLWGPRGTEVARGTRWNFDVEMDVGASNDGTNHTEGNSEQYHCQHLRHDTTAENSRSVEHGVHAKSTQDQSIMF